MSSSQNTHSLYLFIIVVIILVFIAPRFTDRLPHCMMKLFLNPYFRILIVFLSIFLVQYNIFLAIIISLVYIVVMNRLENNILFELFHNENFITNQIDHFNDFNQVDDPIDDPIDDDDDIDDEEDIELDNHSYQGSKEMLTCLNNINDHFPCHNRTKNQKCCESPNYDIMIQNDNDEPENVSLYMNKQLENKDMTGIKNIHKWCKNYIHSHPCPSNIKYGCQKDSLRSKCIDIVKKCRFVRPKPKKRQTEFSGTCGVIDENIHNQVCFDIDSKLDKCKSMNKEQCIQNKKDCFYIENNQFINSKIRKDNSIYKCKIPKEDDKLPKNCYPIKLYKDTCGNVGMGCWVKDQDIPEPVLEDIQTRPPMPNIHLYKRDANTRDFNSKIDYTAPNSMGVISNSTCRT